MTEEAARSFEIYKDAQVSKLGEETVDGHPCVKYEVTYRRQPELKNTHWQAKDLRNFPIRMENQHKSPGGQITKSMLQFKDVSFNQPAAELFEVPKDYRKVSSEAMTGTKMPGVPKGPGGKRKPR